MPDPGPLVPLPCIRPCPEAVAFQTACEAGILRGSATRYGGSVWLEYGDSEPQHVIWPHGYRARFDPLELLDEEGRVVAREGDMVILPGGLRSPGSSDENIQNPIPGLEEAFVVQGRVEVDKTYNPDTP